MNGRGLILAAPSSGSGKTLLTLALLRAFRRLGLRVGAAKAGPDFIDPGFHAAALGAPSVNLDPWAMRESTLTGLAGALEEANEIVLCEGAMGLFDGAGPEGEAGSTAALSRLLGWPIVLLVDARGMGASAAALVRGFASHDPALPLLGVVFNRVRSARHGRLLAQAMARHLPQLALFGALPEKPDFAIPSRHLGLVPAGEIAGIEALIERAAQRVALCLDIDRLLSAARSSGFSAARGAALPAFGGRIAVARDAAFSFLYSSQLEGWKAEGASLSFFSPLAGEAPEREAEAIVLPGGYPELYAGRIAGSHAFLSALRRAAGLGKPIYGECGGYMVLGESLVDQEGRSHPMAGLLPLVSSFQKRQRALGYRSARLLRAGPCGEAGSLFRGHEFHYASILAQEGEPLFAAADAEGRSLGLSGLRREGVSGSFIHLIDRGD